MAYADAWKSTPQTWASLKEAARHNRKRPTPAEAKLWQLLRGRQLAGTKFRRQHAAGPYILDLYCPAARLAVEVDGPIHESQGDNDEARTRFLESARIRIVRFSNQEVLDHSPAVLATIEALLQTGGSHSPPRRGDGEGAGG